MVRTVASLHLAGAYQVTGQLDRAYALLAAAQRDVSGAMQLALQAVSVAQTTDQQRESLGWGHYFLACCGYQRNDLAAAEMHANFVQTQRHAVHRNSVVQSVIVLAATQQAQGNPDAARRTLDHLREHLAEIRSEALLPLIRAFGAELAAQQGDLATAGQWVATVGPQIPLGITAFSYAPQLTLPKILLRIDTPASRQQAAAALTRLHAFVTATHNTRFTIDVLALQSLYHHAEGNEPAALHALEQAVTLARPGGFIRVFVDLGPAMHRLLARLAQCSNATDYIQQVLNAFPTVPAAPSHPLPLSNRPASPIDLVEPLTSRELEILTLLAQRLSAKEIAQRLIISERTVKRHTANIYQKLAVNTRREAVAAAIGLGLLPASQ